MTKTLSLDQVELTFDPATANILLTSNDPRLSGSLKLMISSQTESYRTLLRLLVAEGHADLDEAELPTGTLRVESARDLWIPGRDPRFNLLIGRGKSNLPMALDLRRNLLVAGGSGSGKSIVLRSVLCSGLEQDYVEIRAIDLRKVELGGYAYREQDRFASSKEEALRLLQDLRGEIDSRRKLLMDRGISNFSYPKDGEELSYPVTYLVIDELADLLRSTGQRDSHSQLSNAQSVLISQLILEIVGLGREVGVYLVASTQAVQDVDLDIRVEMPGRILMGRTDPTQLRLLFGRRPTTFGGAYLEPRGRGIVGQRSGVQEVFQAIFIPYDAYRA